ncbi:uncharacterized protein Bfra_007771 [Botrytis fragariae]|uniref:Uncharacterized protein n=1 Tax=Botrytis fragariae TaxID=1964551 RepID=A0A8H6AP67_9HELO|nr:uncharacterized protein Bfra_007771 [Botrytis fragariae]KAF5871256.1 hypothetical protein Bfra_007771 [Botrytis fragariae]
MITAAAHRETSRVDGNNHDSNNRIVLIHDSRLIHYTLLSIHKLNTFVSLHRSISSDNNHLTRSHNLTHYLKIKYPVLKEARYYKLMESKTSDARKQCLEFEAKKNRAFATMEET